MFHNHIPEEPCIARRSAERSGIQSRMSLNVSVLFVANSLLVAETKHHDTKSRYRCVAELNAGISLLRGQSDSSASGGGIYQIVY